MEHNIIIIQVQKHQKLYNISYQTVLKKFCQQFQENRYCCQEQQYSMFLVGWQHHQTSQPFIHYDLQLKNILVICSSKYNRTNLKMSKDVCAQQGQSQIRKKGVKSTDLKKRLFEVGLNSNPNASPLFNTISSPKRNLFPKHPLNFSKKDEEVQLLKFQPSHSPQLIKTHSRDFQIRKSPKQISSPSNKYAKNITLSSFYKSDAIKDEVKTLKERLLQKRQQQGKAQWEGGESKLDEYVGLVLRGVQHIDEFLYLVRGNEENIYELELVQFQWVRSHEGESGFEYYTVSKKGFCQYVGGKPQAFLEISEWAQEKSLYAKIKALKFFYRFRRWKTLQMWRRTVTRQRRQSISHNLQETLFFLQPTARTTLLSLRRLTQQMEKSVLVIAKNDGAYTLQSFKHCQQRARREAALAVEQFSRQSRAVVRKCFQNKLSELRENMKKKSGEDKSSSPQAMTSQSPKESAFQALGFPSKMSYEHRSKLRKEAGRFLRFSYLVDSLHLSCLAGIYSTQVSDFIKKLEEYQLGEEVKLRATIEEGKDEIDREKMFNLQLSCSFKEVPNRLILQLEDSEEWSPTREIRLKKQDPSVKKCVPRLCQYWLSMAPSLDQVFDQLGFLIREGLASLKCFQKWARHRQMQKYVSILEEWDDLVSDNWQISQNDNLDPLLLLDSLDPSFTKMKGILKTTQYKLMDTIRNTLSELLNAYWQYSQLPLLKLQSHELANPAETFDQFLKFTSKLLERVTNQLPHRVELGVITIQITRVKTILGQKFAGIFEGLRIKLPQLVEERTGILNNWLIGYGGRLRQEILNIDDFVKLVDVVKEIQKEFGQRRQECNELAQLYQTMQNFRMDTRRRKDFQSVTLKLKDQLEQLISTAEQNIERKSDLYTNQVLKYHIPSLLKDINKTLENVQQPRFLKLDSYRPSIQQDLTFLKDRQKQLIQQRQKCQKYMTALKIHGQQIGELNQLSLQIKSRVDLWKILFDWQILCKEYQSQSAKSLPFSLLIELVDEHKENVHKLEEFLPPNEVLSFLKSSIKEYYVYLPLLGGFNENLSESHWVQIYEILPQKFGLDLKKRQFTFQDFLKSGIGNFAKQIQQVFERCRVQAKLQRQYQSMQESWLNMNAKIRVEGKFTLIANGQALREQIDNLLFQFTALLSNPHAQSLKQYSITYDIILLASQSFDAWLKIQDKIVEIQKNCRLLDIKKLPDYNFFENAERIYKQITKLMSNKGAQTGVRIGKLLVFGVEEKLSEIQGSLNKVQDNIRGILRQHRRAFPSFYLFNDSQLLKLITQQSTHSIQSAAIRLIPSISHIQFENERISCIVTIDDDRFIKNPISTSSDIQQILFQITETVSQLNRRALRNCRYKAVQNNISSLVQQYNIQHLLAISRVDFSQYTSISIENQLENPDSLAQFRKVMRKDTAEDIKNRNIRLSQSQAIDFSNTIKSTKTFQKYDTLLLQQLLYEEILDYVIKNQIQRPEQYPWASQMKFFWEDTSNDDPNITVKQMHLSLKYGNQFIGSKTRVIVQSQVQTFLGYKYNQCVVYNGSFYNLERVYNAIGYKINTLTCSQLISEYQLKKFLIGCYFTDYIPFFNRADQLKIELLESLPNQKWIDEFKCNVLKRNSPYLKEIQKNTSIFMNIRDSGAGWYSLQGKMRVINYQPPKKEYLACTLRLKGLYSEDRSSLLLRIFEAVGYLDQKSKMQGVCIEQFFDLFIIEPEDMPSSIFFQKILQYLKQKVTLQTFSALNKHLQELALLPFDERKIYENKTKLQNIIETLKESHIVILIGKGKSKKHFLKKKAQKLEMEFIELYGQTYNKNELFGNNSEKEHLIQKSLFQKLVEESKEDRLVYFQGVTFDLLLALQNFIYSNAQNLSKLAQSKLSIVLDLYSIEKFMSPRQLSSFPVIHYQSSKDYISDKIVDWLSKLSSPEETKKALNRILTQTILSALQTLSGKDEFALQEKLCSFLEYLSSLHPFKNLLQACIYSLINVYRGSQDDQIKLQYLVKKYLGEQRLSQDVKILNLIYRRTANQQKLISQKEFHKYWIEENGQFHDQAFIITPNSLHALILTRRIHQNTNNAVIIEGQRSTGKSTHLYLYRKLNHDNSFYLQITPILGSQWIKKLSLGLQKHGMNMLGAKINYLQTVILVDDVHLADRTSMKPIQLLLFYSKFRLQKKEYQLRNVKVILSANKCPSSLQRKTLKVFMNSNKNELYSIFNEFSRKMMDRQWDISDLQLQKISTNTIDICKKITSKFSDDLKQAYSVAKRILSGFSKLKIKQGLAPQKETQKFWTFSLIEGLNAYDMQKQLDNQLKKLDLSSLNITVLSYSHLSTRPADKKIQFMKDPKRLYNYLNEKIEKYNESDTKRYGQGFQFLNFDSIIQKVVTISHSIMLDSDHLLVGRKGSGKQSLVKLCAFFNGLFYRNIQNSIKSSLIELVESGVTSPYLLFKNIIGADDFKDVQEYYLCDFESQILTHSQNKSKSTQKQKQRMMNTKSIHKNNSSIQSFVTPKTKLNWEEYISLRKSFRIVSCINNREDIKNLVPQVRSKVHIDIIEEVPSLSIMQYNEKLLGVDGVACGKKAQVALSQIFQYSRERLGLSLRSNDDCVRLFSSFIANLIQEMVLEEERYKRILQLLYKLRLCCKIISDQVSNLHFKLKQLSLASQTVKEDKAKIQTALRQKSTAQSIGQKLTDILGWLQVLYESRRASINRNLQNREHLQLSFAVTASYFIYLSNLGFDKRREQLNQWYNKVSSLKELKPMQSFLPLFLLYQDEFSTDPVDDLPQFYENMAIIFHSAKPIAIRDKTHRGKSWLQKNCMFVSLKDDNKDFHQILKQLLGKSNNIMIEVSDQQTLDKLSESPMGTLLFLPEAVNSVNLKGEQVEIHQEAKVYLVLRQDLHLPKDLQLQFTIVVYQESEMLARKALEHQYYSTTQRQHYTTMLDYHRRIHKQKTDCQNSIGQIAESIYEQLCGSEMPPSENVLAERLNRITDKLISKAQSQFTRIKEWEDSVRDLSQKKEIVQGKLHKQPIERFYDTSVRAKSVLDLMSQSREGQYRTPTYAEYFSLIKHCLSRGIILSEASLIMLVLRQWGPIYQPNHYTIFAYLLLLAYNQKQPKLFIQLLDQNGIKNQQFFGLIGSNHLLKDEYDLQKTVINRYIHVYNQEAFGSLGPFVPYTMDPYYPILWPIEENTEALKIVNISSHLQASQIRQKLLSIYPRLLEPSEEDSLELQLKKCNLDQIQVLVWSKQGLKQAEKAIRAWSLIEKTIIFLKDSSSIYRSSNHQYFWNIFIDNDQTILNQIFLHYKKADPLELQQKQQEVIISGVNLVPLQGKNQEFDITIESDGYLRVLHGFLRCIKWKYQTENLCLPQIKIEQLIAIRRLIDSDSSMTTKEKVQLLLNTLLYLFKNPSTQISIYIENLKGRLIKLCGQSFKEQDYFADTQAILSQGLLTSQEQQRSKQLIQLQLGWLLQTRQFFGLDNEAIITKYIQIIEEFMAMSIVFTGTTAISRGSKRQVNIKGRRDSSTNNKKRQSQSLGKKTIVPKNLKAKAQSSRLAALYLYKQFEQIEQTLLKIYKDLSVVKIDLQKKLQSLSDKNSKVRVRQETIVILVYLLRDQPIKSWKSLLTQGSSFISMLSLSIKALISKRNELFTYHNKFSISQSCELDFRNIKKPVEFLRIFFRSQLNSQEIFILTTFLTSEEAERGDYLRVNGLLGLGLRITADGLLETVGDGKLLQFNGCFIVKKQLFGITATPVDLLLSPKKSEIIMKLFVPSKKSQNVSVGKIYLKGE